VSAGLAGSPSIQFAWNGLAYFQAVDSSRTISRVDDNRQGERPWIDEFAVPVRAIGATWTGAWWGADNNSRTIVGVDLRQIRGESRQHLVPANGGFTRLRVAGGHQGHAGLNVARHQYVSARLRGEVAVRIDAVRDWDGHIQETDIISGALLRDARYSARDDLIVTSSAGVVWDAAPTWQVRVNGQSSFHRPTLGERFGISVAGGILTDANPDLRPERITSVELAIVHRPARAAFIEAAVFANRRANVLSSLAADDTTRRRVNIDRAQLDGIRLAVGFQPAHGVTIEAQGTWLDSRVTRFESAPVSGLSLPGVLHHTVVVTTTWQARATTAVVLRVRASGRFHPDLENDRQLGGAVVADFGLHQSLSDRMEVFITGANIINTRVPSHTGARGETYFASPRCWSGGVRFMW
jgi:outer membrane receptor protein involved in Fe transport